MMRPNESRRTRWRVPRLLLTALLLAAAPAGAQETCDESAGSLGIQGLSCEGCTYTMSESGIDAARFRTEPQILAVVRGFSRGDQLRAGDRIVAVDGALITTRNGGDRLVNLEAGDPVTLRVRRDGRVVELRMVAGSACELRRRMRTSEVELDRVPAPMMPGFNRPELPPAPELPSAPDMPELPDLPELPEPPQVPAGYLGIGLQCSRCSIGSGVFHFTSPPEITGVADGGPGAEAGLRPGDVILEVRGRDITGEGGRLFSELEPGDTATLTIRRDGDRRSVTVAATDRPERAPAPMAPQPIGDRLRFQGTVGDTRVEVRGGPVTVTRNEETGEVVIRSGFTVVRLTPEGGG